ncbi:hypothetical protein ACIQXA_02110 [Streptomyces massasporeus]|uniref:hypothetical protein n=1 Tax=Streptomyces massasporeus TaxID=67324 RepID=UPI0038167F87
MRDDPEFRTAVPDLRNAEHPVSRSRVCRYLKAAGGDQAGRSKAAVTSLPSDDVAWSDEDQAELLKTNEEVIENDNHLT